MASVKPQATAPFQEVPRLRHPLSLEQFYGEFYIPRRPVIIDTGSLAQLGWQTQRWTNDYLMFKAGAQEVMVLRRDDARNFAPDGTRYTSMPFHEFLKRVMVMPQGDRD